MHIADQKGIAFSDVRNLDEDAVYRRFYPDKFAVETLYAQLDFIMWELLYFVYT